MAFLLLCASCSHETDNSPRRLAILPPEILIDDASSEWLSTGLPLVWEEDLATAPHLLVSVMKDTSNAYQSGATELLRTTVENRGGRLRFEGFITDASTQRNQEVFEVTGAASGGLLPIANAFAKHIDEHATDFSTKNERAFAIFSDAFRAPEAALRMQKLNEAVGVDPGFGLAYIVLAQLTTQTNPQNLGVLLSEAGKHVNAFTSLDRVKFNALAAQVSHAPLSQQETAYRQLLQIAPNALDALVALGSTRFLAGDTAGGEQLLRRALALNPGNVNIHQQLARGLLESKRFREAEKILAALDNNPAVLPSLAVCVLLEGDLRRADAIAERFSQSLQPDVQILYRASWLAISGRTAEAAAALEGRHLADPNLASAALAERVIWRIMLGDFAAAKQTLATETGTPGAFALQSSLLSQADAPLEEWQEKVQTSELNAEQKQNVAAYGLFLAGHNAEAAVIWQQILDHSGGVDLRARAMLASARDRAGNPEGAKSVLVQPFVPEFGDLYAAVSFREMRRLLNLKVQ